ncbi:flagellar biosynthesis regulator FlaF [Paracraurococcus lichenis]|uniref:Flagellar biosynthesis regulator FlaF n=1 Tax=Paracraurococcus lichenis TaxID=3064888 RepID=A0ABT9DSU9_9PROT|nr:flagellar biosynthesis regulator FlaF [Paracraurococcus sp. LOR1-02]MDO9706972.1 flagellar biosynthesis regulator FlaF [Paracraurococcus sp. LOR1-02]
MTNPNPAPDSPQPALSGAAAYRRRLTPKQMEAEVFARATRSIRAAEAEGPLARARALADNRRLWDVVHALVLDPTNVLPPALRGQIAGVALAVLREFDRPEPDLGFIAEMNEHFAAGLWR